MHRAGTFPVRPFPDSVIPGSKNIKMFVLNDVDELLSRHSKKQIYDIFTTMPQNIQVIFLSTNMPSYILIVTTKFMNDPVKIFLGKQELTKKKFVNFILPSSMSIRHGHRFRRRGIAINFVTDENRRTLRDIEQV
ncbi:unnamed protein product [Didymodactylos carnosus]|uniref:Uncharacterized protein n=1 Tax=Didymodactylos carnosus TaxID=1234261 RepID=A0A815YNJ0_9BILA|nr:unnamed protein product [Didymodactylos carnosus]CAF1573237.1 unnamed protein product [Didymodactylos carnosus]CAF3671166.1 unnamed protein product [Didymodactylos carnosus]CAF4437132.1 unnamed protein product [Didymodactylos carnosus]